MARKKKKRGVEKEKKTKKKSLNERETLAFEQQIVDYNRQLARLRSANKELEDQLVSSKQSLKILEEDRNDVVAHLKRKLEGKSEETRELNERLIALEETRKEELANFRRREEAMETEFRTMESNLSAEVKLAAGKLNALEDWRLARNDLMEKFERQEQEAEEREERHRKSLYEAEKSLVIGKTKMQREMEERLQNLSLNLQRSSSVQLAESSRRTIRENRALNRYVDELSCVLRNQEKDLSIQKEIATIQRLEAELLSEEEKILLSKILNQRAKIFETSNSLEILRSFLTKTQRQIEEAELRSKDEGNLEVHRREISKTLEKLENALKEKETILQENLERKKKIEDLENVLGRAKKWILENLEKEEMEDECPEAAKLDFLSTLRNILEHPVPVVKLESEEIECRYERGNLGFVSPFLEENEEEEEETEPGKQR